MAETSPHWREPGPRKPPTIGDWTQVGIYRSETSEEGKSDDHVGGGILGILEARRIDREAMERCKDPWD